MFCEDSKVTKSQEKDVVVSLASQEDHSIADHSFCDADFQSRPAYIL